MLLPCRGNGGEGSGEDLEQLLGGVATGWKARALGWPVLGERGEHEVTAGADGAGGGGHVPGPVSACGEEVEDGSVVPHTS